MGANVRVGFYIEVTVFVWLLLVGLVTNDTVFLPSGGFVGTIYGVVTGLVTASCET